MQSLTDDDGVVFLFFEGIFTANSGFYRNPVRQIHLSFFFVISHICPFLADSNRYLNYIMSARRSHCKSKLDFLAIFSCQSTGLIFQSRSLHGIVSQNMCTIIRTHKTILHIIILSFCQSIP